jgi:hypothetical protein
MPLDHRSAPRFAVRAAIRAARALVAAAIVVGGIGARGVSRREVGRRAVTVGARAVGGGRTRATDGQPAAIAYVIPQQQPDQAALKTLLAVLADHGIEIRRALAPFASGRVRYSAGAYIVLGSQPHASAAAALLDPAFSDVGNAGDRRSATSGDSTAVGLKRLLGVGVAEVRDSFPVPVTAPIVPVPPRYITPPGLGDSARRVVGVYTPPNAARPVAWTRATLGRFGVVYAPIDPTALSDGGAMHEHYDVVLLPDAGSAPYAAVSGSGLRAFLDAGGTIVAVGSGARWAERTLGLAGRFDDIAPTADRAGGADIDSALVDLQIDRASPMAADMVAHAVAWVAGGPTTVFVPDTTHSRVVARYDPGDVVRASQQVARAYDGAAAIVDVPQGRGRVVLFGFDPAYRGVSLATLPLLWGALRFRAQ